MEIVNAWVVLCDGEPESVTRKVTFVLPAVEGVPVIWPLAANRVKPGGSDPAPMLQVYAGVPPRVARVGL